MNGGTLDGSTLSVTSEVVYHDEPHDVTNEGHPIEQTDKPRAGSMYNFLAVIFSAHGNPLKSLPNIWPKDTHSPTTSFSEPLTSIVRSALLQCFTTRSSC